MHEKRDFSTVGLIKEEQKRIFENKVCEGKIIPFWNYLSQKKGASLEFYKGANSIGHAQIEFDHQSIYVN